MNHVIEVGLVISMVVGLNVPYILESNPH